MLANAPLAGAPVGATSTWIAEPTTAGEYSMDVTVCDKHQLVTVGLDPGLMTVEQLEQQQLSVVCRSASWCKLTSIWLGFVGVCIVSANAEVGAAAAAIISLGCLLILLWRSPAFL